MVDGEGCRTDIKWFSENTSIPIVIKGVQTGGWELVQSAPIARYLYAALDTCALLESALCVLHSVVL